MLCDFEKSLCVFDFQFFYLGNIYLVRMLVDGYLWYLFVQYLFYVLELVFYSFFIFILCSQKGGYVILFFVLELDIWF